MASRTPKVLHQVAGQPLLHYSLDLAKRLKSQKTIVVLGHEAQQVMEWGGLKAQYVKQVPQLGTGHAVAQAKGALKGFGGDVLVLYGDVPLLSVKTVSSLLREHRRYKNVLTILTTTAPNPRGYGRMIRRQDGVLVGIIEEKNATASQKKIQEINSGIIVVQARYLFSRLSKIKKDKIKQEYYLTDLVAIAEKEKKTIGSFHTHDFAEIQGINSLAELAQVEATLQKRIQSQWMAKGVTFRDPTSTQVESAVTLSPDTIIGPQVSLRGKTKVGHGTFIDQGSVIVDSILGRETVIQPYCMIEESRVGDGVTIGPFAHLRPLSQVDNQAHIGNFVELKKTHMKAGAKANHLSYLGDAVIGKCSNVGAGTITCNYDGVKKYKTELGDDVFVGSDTQLVAPVKVGRGAYLGAGSTITKNVPAGALALSRSEQRNIPGWAKRKKKKRV
jgi:bifunctional UDP-N-acetylglucosamine pyrophosphorylase / glucosamine-1-phosphate N-acetyltransferase